MFLCGAPEVLNATLDLMGKATTRHLHSNSHFVICTSLITCHGRLELPHGNAANKI